MPQMAPLWWTIIMLFTLMIMLIIVMINYFNFSNKLKTKSSFFNNKMTWKW